MDLPGGGKEAAESIDECAVREAFEETGYKIKTYNRLGEYRRNINDDIQYFFLSKIIRGIPIKSGSETSELRWFTADKLPMLMVPHRKEQIKDYINGNIGVVKDLKDNILFFKIIRLIGTLIFHF